jgi:hypothetical protein
MAAARQHRANVGTGAHVPPMRWTENAVGPRRRDNASSPPASSQLLAMILIAANARIHWANGLFACFLRFKGVFHRSRVTGAPPQAQ